MLLFRLRSLLFILWIAQLVQLSDLHALSLSAWFILPLNAVLLGSSEGVRKNQMNEEHSNSLTLSGHE